METGQHMVPSRTLIELLKQVESLRLKPYDDQTDQEISAWVPGATVGYGHLIPKAEWPTFKGGISVVQANALFERDLAPLRRRGPQQAVSRSAAAGIRRHGHARIQYR